MVSQVTQVLVILVATAVTQRFTSPLVLKGQTAQIKSFLTPLAVVVVVVPLLTMAQVAVAEALEAQVAKVVRMVPEVLVACPTFKAQPQATR